MPEPHTTPAACGFRHDEWDGPYRMPRRCVAPAGHSDGQFAYDHGPWECLALGWRDQPTDGTSPGATGRTETGATTANVQVEGGEPGDSGCGHLRDQLCEAFIQLIRDHADRSVIAPGYMADAALAVRDQEMEALRAELVATVANLNRADEDGARAEVAERRAQAVARTAREEIRRRREAEDTLDRVRNVAVELELFAEAALKVPDRELYATIAKSLRTALTPPADQDRGGQ